MQRVISYIDGFNLYFGLKDKGWKRFYWLNISNLTKRLLKSGQSLHSVKYFTSRISLPADKVKRQTLFIEALETLPDVKIYYGKYQRNDVTCTHCGHVMYKPNEKMTDVNIAVEMLSDAFRNQFDIAILISADSDLTGPVKLIRELFPDKQVVIAFPPSRFSYDLQNAAHASFTIGRRNLSASLFPDQITKPDGFVIIRPEKWNQPD